MQDMFCFHTQLFGIKRTRSEGVAVWCEVMACQDRKNRFTHRFLGMPKSFKLKCVKTLYSNKVTQSLGIAFVHSYLHPQQTCERRQRAL